MHRHLIFELRLLDHDQFLVDTTLRLFFEGLAELVAKAFLVGMPLGSNESCNWARTELRNPEDCLQRKLHIGHCHEELLGSMITASATPHKDSRFNLDFF